MKLLREALEEKAFDLRLLDRNLTRGTIQSDDAKKAKDQLPDESEFAEYVSLDELAQSSGQ